MLKCPRARHWTLNWSQWTWQRLAWQQAPLGVCVCLCESLCKVLWGPMKVLKALYNCSPFTIYRLEGTSFATGLWCFMSWTLKLRLYKNSFTVDGGESHEIHFTGPGEHRQGVSCAVLTFVRLARRFWHSKTVNSLRVHLQCLEKYL